MSENTCCERCGEPEENAEPAICNFCKRQYCEFCAYEVEHEITGKTVWCCQDEACDKKAFEWSTSEPDNASPDACEA